MATKQVSNLSDKLTKVNDNFMIYMYENGYMIEVSGRNKKGDCTSAKIMCSNIEQLAVLVEEACTMERDS
jgi:hypothetical protein